MKRFHQRISPGFSLIELMLVIAIIAVFAAMAAPRYRGSLTRYRVDAAAQRLSADITMAQSRARATASSRSVVFNGTSGGYQILSERDLKVAANTYTVDLTVTPYFVSVSTVNFAGGATLTFNGYGVPNAAGSVMINSGSASRTVSIDADSGIVKIQ